MQLRNNRSQNVKMYGALHNFEKLGKNEAFTRITSFHNSLRSQNWYCGGGLLSFSRIEFYTSTIFTHLKSNDS